MQKWSQGLLQAIWRISTEKYPKTLSECYKKGMESIIFCLSWRMRSILSNADLVVKDNNFVSSKKVYDQIDSVAKGSS